MQAIRIINIRAKAGTIITVPDNEVWKIESRSCASEKYDIEESYFRNNPTASGRILGGGYKDICR